MNEINWINLVYIDILEVSLVLCILFLWFHRFEALSDSKSLELSTFAVILGLVPEDTTDEGERTNTCSDVQWSS